MGQKQSRSADYYLLVDENANPERLAHQNVFHHTVNRTTGLPILFYGSPRCGKTTLINSLVAKLKTLQKQGNKRKEIEYNFNIIPTEISSNIESTLQNNEYRFTAIAIMVDLSTFHEGTRESNPIMKVYREVLRVANLNRTREIPILVMFTQKAALQETIKIHCIHTNFPEFQGNNTANEIAWFFVLKFKQIRQLTYRNDSYYAFMTDAVLAMNLFTQFHEDHLDKDHHCKSKK